MLSRIWRCLLFDKLPARDSSIDRAKIPIATLRMNKIGDQTSDSRQELGINEGDIEVKESAPLDETTTELDDSEEEGQMLGKRKPLADTVNLGLTETKAREIKRAYDKRLECSLVSKYRPQKSRL